MTEHLLIQIMGIVFLGIAAKWISWKFQLPSILLLLIIGVCAGPVTGFLNPDELLGKLLFPVVSISVAIILFEGGLSLSLQKLKDVGGVFTNLITLGALLTWAIAAASAHVILGFHLELSVLLGAILVVTGPTVIIPLLAHIHPNARLSAILKWEGIVIDPIGAMLAVLVFETILAGGFSRAPLILMMGVLKTVLFGGGIGVFVAYLMIQAYKHYWIPDELTNAVSMAAVISAFVLSNHFQSESGLLTVTLMGILLANQKEINIRPLVQFKETLRVLLISTLFIILAARLTPQDLSFVNSGSFLFLAVLIFIARPLSVWVSTYKSELNWREKVFLACVAPRGIIAASVSSVFALYLVERNYPGAEELVPITFFVIVGTVTFYGLGAAWIAKLLGVGAAASQGVLMIGAHPWSRGLAKTLLEENIKVLMVDTNRTNVHQAKMENIPVSNLSALSQEFLDEVELEGIGKLLAFTSNDQVNSLAAVRFKEVFSPADVYQLSPQKSEKEKEEVSKHLQGRILFGPKITFDYLTLRFLSGAQIKKTKLSAEFTFEQFQNQYGSMAVPLFVINEKKQLSICTAEKFISPKAGQTVISLVDVKTENSS